MDIPLGAIIPQVVVFFKWTLVDLLSGPLLVVFAQVGYNGRGGVMSVQLEEGLTGLGPLKGISVKPVRSFFGPVLAWNYYQFLKTAGR